MAQATNPPRPFPVKQFVILSICRLCEPIAFCSIFPYIYYMIDSFGIAKNDNDIALFAGMVTSAFTLAEFTTGMLWGSISDRVGRKPVLLGGLFGTLLSMLLFGFAKSFPVALLARAAGGFLNGNIGVIQTTVAEMVPNKEHQPRAFAIMPFVWCVGSIIGPAVGGALADPVKQYPEYFLPGGFLEKYPYALPNLFCVAALVVGLMVGILFFEETHEELKHRKDYGRELGEKLVSVFSFTRSYSIKRSEASSDDRTTLLGSPTEENYETFSGSPSSTTSVGNEVSISASPRKPAPIIKAFTPQVIHIVISYGILALHTIGFEQLYPVFLSTPPATVPPSSLFKFVGGYGLSTREVGVILTVQGVLSMFIQFMMFPPIVGYFGALKVYKFVMLIYPMSYIIVPYLDFLPTEYHYAGIYVVLVIKLVFGCLAYPCNMILLTNSSPSLLVLGSINGVAASVASLCRSIGPTVSGLLYSAGLEMGCVGLAWWINGGVCVVGAIQALLIVEPSEKIEDTQVVDEDTVRDVAVEAAIKCTTAVGVSADECVDEYAIIRRECSRH